MSRRLIVEADGGSRGNPGPAAYGALVRDADTGEVLAEVAEAIGVATNNVAEYRGLMAGLVAAAGIDPDATVEARLDSKLVVEQMSGRWKIKNADLRPIALEARRILPPEHVSYTWVPRAQNAAADRLVNQALDDKPIGGTSAFEAGGAARGRTVTAPRVPSAADVAEAAAPAAPGRRLIAWSPDLGTPTSLHLVRHGRTPMTVAKQFSGGGVEGPGLDDTGREQAAQAAERLAPAGIVAVIASPMLRTRQTAEIIAGRLGLSVRIDDGWRECEFGDWEGKTLEEIVDGYPAELTAWHDATGAAPGGESLEQMSRRAAVARDKAIARFPGQSVVVVTHSMPVRALVRLALEASPTALFRLQPAPGSVTQINAYNDGTQAVTSFGQRD